MQPSINYVARFLEALVAIKKTNILLKLDQVLYASIILLTYNVSQCCRICWCGLAARYPDYLKDCLSRLWDCLPDWLSDRVANCPTIWQTDRPLSSPHLPVVSAELKDVGHLGIQNLLKTNEKILAVNICVAQNVGTVWIGRERPWSFFIPFHVCIPMEQNITKYHKKTLVS